MDRTIQSYPARRAMARALIFGCLLLLCGAPLLQAATVRAALDRTTTRVGESVTLSVIVEGGSVRGQPRPPAVPGLQVVGTGSSQNFTLVDGQRSASQTFTYRMVPTQAGDFTIPAISVNVDGQTLASRPLQIKVLPASQPPPGQPEPAFLRLEIPRDEMFVGEVLPVQVELFVQNARDLSLPQFQSEGFSVGKMADPEQANVRVGNTEYVRVTFRFPVTATRIGALTLGPVTCNLTLLMGQRNFFGNFSEARPVSLTSPEQAVRVHPLPSANRPADFNGAVGNYRLTMNASPTTVAVGDPITVQVRIEGSGALDLLTLPPQPAWREFKSYTPSSRIDSADPLALQGAKTFEMVIAPQNAEISELPPFSFSFFDPEKKAYRTVNSDAIALDVRPTVATPQPTILAADTVSGQDNMPAQEIVHIKPQLGMMQPVSVPLIQRAWFLALQAVAPLLWVGAILVRKRRENFEANPRLRREKEVARVMQAGLRQLSQHAAANRSEEFFATTFRLLQEQLGERLDLPASAITEAVIEERLRPGGLDEPAADLLHQLFQLCNQARYAPIRSSEELASWIPRVESALRELRRWKE